MAPIILYHSPVSASSRAVLLLARYLKLDVEIKLINLMEKEQLAPEFVAINPQHCIPTINDDGFVLWESRAILAYLLESKAPQLLQTSPKEKAIVNQRLHFELGGLMQVFGGLFYPVFGGATEIDEKKIQELYDIFFTIDEHYFPNGNEWIAGEVITTADFAYAATISTLVEVGASLEKYPRIAAWLDRCKATFPDYAEANEQGTQMFAGFINSTVTKGF